MSTSSRLLLRASTAAGTVAVLMASGAGALLFASPAAADVNGYQTGYSYHQGLATGAGANLMANSASTENGAAANSVGTNAVTSQTSPAAPAVTPNAAPAAQSQTQAQAVTPAAQPAANTVDVAPAAPAAAQTAPAATAFANVITPIAWAVIVVALLALIAAGIWAASREPADRERVRRTTTYRRTA